MLETLVIYATLPVYLLIRKEVAKVDINVITDFISNVGFPIFVAIYLLYDGSKKRKQSDEVVSKLTETVEKNNALIETMLDKMDEEV